jgi:hypothetical protein
MWQKGQSGNPKGRPKGRLENNFRELTVLIALLKKILPDLKAVDMKLTQPSPFRLIIDVSDIHDGKEQKPKSKQKSELEKSLEARERFSLKMGSDN